MKKNQNYIVWAVVIIVVVILVVWFGKGDSVEAPENLTPVAETSTIPVTNPLIGEKITPAGAAARIYLSTRLNIDAKEIKVTKEDTKVWSNACLDVAEPGVVCAQVITPGYEITLEARGTEYKYRTNNTGSKVVAVM
jgi:hypothetical protein